MIRSMLVVTALLIGLVSSPASAQPITPSQATAEALSPITYSSSTCFDVDSSAHTVPAPNVWDHIAWIGSYPSARSNVRWVRITHADKTDRTIPVCLQLGSQLSAGSSLQCMPETDQTYSTGIILPSYGSTELFLVSRYADGSMVPIYARAEPNATVTICVTSFW